MSKEVERYTFVCDVENDEYVRASDYDALATHAAELEKDAARWRYTQQGHYFETGPHSSDGDWYGYSVGVLKYVDDPSIIYGHPKGKRQLPLNHCIEGRGDTLQEAIDEALWGTHEEHLA